MCVFVAGAQGFVPAAVESAGLGGCSVVISRPGQLRRGDRRVSSAIHLAWAPAGPAHDTARIICLNRCAGCPNYLHPPTGSLADRR